MAVDWVRLELDLSTAQLPSWTFDHTDVRLTTLSVLGDTEAHRRRLFELNRTCSADIPDRGPFHTWDEYRRLRLDVPSFDPAAISLAVVDNGDASSVDWIGMASFSTHLERGYLFGEMTGVVRAWRRQGLARALKVHNLQLARATGVPTIRTVHHPGNAAMIALNRSLGYTDADWPYPS